MNKNEYEDITFSVTSPTTDELKERFQARSIPLAADFENLIDVAEYGRRALGMHPEQTPNPSSGLQVQESGQLAVKLDPGKGMQVVPTGMGVVVNETKGLQVDADGIGIRTAAQHGLKLDANHLKLSVSASNPGIELGSDGVKVKPNQAKGVMVEAAGVGINTASRHGLKLEDNSLKLALCASHPGIELGDDGVRVKHNPSAGLTVNESGIGVVVNRSKGMAVDGQGLAINPGNGLAFANNQLSLKLAKGTATSNSGGGQGINGSTSGNHGGLSITADGLAVDAGRGMQIDAYGVSIKPYPNWGLDVNENGLWVVPNQASGIKVDSNGVGVVANAAKGMMVDVSGIGINTAPQHGLKLESNALKLAISANNPGVMVESDGVKIKPHSGAGVKVDANGIGVVANGAKGVAVDSNGVAVVANTAKGVVVEPQGVGINTAPQHGLKLEENALKLAVASSTPGLEVGADGVKVKPNSAAGIKVDSGGVGVLVNPGKGMTLDGQGVAVNPGKGLIAKNNQINIKLAKGEHTNGGDSHGENGTTEGASGGLFLSDNGLSINPGNGMWLDKEGISIKCGANSGLSASEYSGGLTLNIDNTLRVNNSNQLGVVPNYVSKSGDSTIANGNLTFSDDFGINFYGGYRIAKKRGTGMLWFKGLGNILPQICNNDGSNPSNIATESYVQANRVLPATTNSGLEQTSDGLKFKPKVNGGLGMDNSGVGINTAAQYGLKLDANQLKLSLSASNPGIELASDGVKVKPNLAKGLLVEAAGVGINTATQHGLRFDGNALKLALSASNPGIELASDGVRVKPNLAKGLLVDGNGVGINTGNGLIAANNKLNIAHDTTLQINGSSQLGVSGFRRLSYRNERLPQEGYIYLCSIAQNEVAAYVKFRVRALVRSSNTTNGYQYTPQIFVMTLLSDGLSNHNEGARRITSYSMSISEAYAGSHFAISRVCLLTNYLNEVALYLNVTHARELVEFCVDYHPLFDVNRASMSNDISTLITDVHEAAIKASLNTRVNGNATGVLTK
ncbi:hypothetical protein [Aeromonas sp. SG16]|uniref:hypothetical protein n=1 Tax=Aeromonas sp. SG16 TaxID=2950548 RepID=UPI00210D05D8|nr:hypothetical protein [Aeromonas sp. SG16]MCQ4054447.1 hypothetical protein [Aeromonas sp. SG16]